MTWLEPLDLEETDDVLNVRPRLALDPLGGFLVTDAPEAQLRLYDSSGSLRLALGREGDGPGEFSDLAAAGRFESGAVVAADFNGRISIWSERGALQRDFRVEIQGIIGLAATGPDRLAVVSIPRPQSLNDPAAPIVHEVSVPDGDVTGSFFELPLNPSNAMAALTVQGTVAPIMDDQFGITWSVFDSLWVIDLQRRAVASRLRIGSPRLAANEPPVDRRRDPEGFSTWMRETTFPVEALPGPEGTWFVTTTYSGDEGRSWGTIYIDGEGELIWELHPSPRLMATDPERGILYFAEPSGLIPGRFLRARLRR